MSMDSRKVHSEVERRATFCQIQLDQWWLGIMTTLIFSVLFGSIGVGYFIYGKKQQRLIPLIVGIGLCALPYFIPNTYALVIVGLILTAAPWLLSEE